MPRQLPPPLATLAARQSGVVSRAQLRAEGITADHVRSAVRAGRWQTAGRFTVVLHSGALTTRQRQWAALLNCGHEAAALAGRTAAGLHGLEGWPSDVVHVLVPHGLRVPRLPGVRVHETRRDLLVARHPTREPPSVRLERAVVDAAGWEPNSRTAAGLLAAAVQQKLTTAERLFVEVTAAIRMRHRHQLMLVLGDIEGGAQSLAEIDLAGLAREAGLSPPLRQAVRLDEHGRRRYLDAVFPRRSGGTFNIEVDGALHLIAQNYWDDRQRDNEQTIAGEPTLRFPTVAMRLTGGWWSINCIEWATPDRLAAAGRATPRRPTASSGTG